MRLNLRATGSDDDQPRASGSPRDKDYQDKTQSPGLLDDGEDIEADFDEDYQPDQDDDGEEGDMDDDDDDQDKGDEDDEDQLEVSPRRSRRSGSDASGTDQTDGRPDKVSQCIDVVRSQVRDLKRVYDDQSKEHAEVVKAAEAK